MGSQVRTPALPPGFTLDTATMPDTEPDLPDLPELPEGFRLATPSIPGTEQTGLPGVPVINPRRVIREVDAPGAVKGALDVTLGAVGRGVGAVVEGLGGALEASPLQHPLSRGRGKGHAKALIDVGRYLSKRPAWIDEISESPERWTDPAFIANLAFEGAGSTLPGLVTGLGAAGVVGRVAARVPVPVLQKAAAFATGTTIGSFFETLTDAGSAYNDAIERHGASPEAAALVFTETVKREFPLTAGMSVTEFLPLAKGGMARALQVGVNAALEGGEEVAQGAAQRSVRRDVLGEDVSLLEGAEEEFAGGVLGGGLLHGARAAARRLAQPGTEVVSDEVDIDDDIPLAAIPESIQPERAPVQPRGSREAAQAVAAEKLRQAGAKQSVAQVVDEARAWLADRDGPFDRNDFVDDTGNNPIQTAAAFAKLESEGLIRGRRGDGRTVYERVALASHEVASGDSEVLPLPGEADPGVSRDDSTRQSVSGRETSIAVPGETTRYRARFAVRELEDVQASHTEDSFQPNEHYAYSNDRDYSQVGNAARVIENAASFDPEFVLADSPTAEQGAPIVDLQGNVLGGNNRRMTIGRVYQFHSEKAAAYKAALVERAAQFGLDPEAVAAMRRPVLVRERTEAPVDAQREITDYNKTAAAKLNPGEQAVTDGRRMGERTVVRIVGQMEEAGESGTLADALRGEGGAEVIQLLVADGVITEQEKNAYIDERDNLTQEGKARIARALVGRMFTSPAQWNNTPPALRAKLERIAPYVARVEERGDWALTGKVRKALDLLEDARVHGKAKLEDVVKQTSITGEGHSREALAVAQVLAGKPTEAAAAFRWYANDEALSRPGAQQTMFTPPTQAEAFSESFGQRQAEGGESGGSVYLGSGLGALQPWFSQKLSQALHRSANMVARALNPKRVAEAVDMVRPLETVLAKEGQGAGAPLMAALNRAKHTGEVSAGKRLVRLVDANVQKLTRDEAFNLMDALEGRIAPMNARVANAFQVARSLRDEVADEAMNLGVYVRTSRGRVPFAPLANYYPHVIHGPDALGGGKLRQDVLDNMVRMGLSDVENLLDSYRRFVESGVREQRLLDHLVQSGQAVDDADALAKLKRYRKHVKRHGNIEFSRELNLPFYDPDPRRSLPRHAVGASIRLAQVAELGQENQFVNRQLKNIEDAGGNSDWAERAVDKIVGWANQADQKDAKVLRVARAIQGFKLSLAAIPNSTQGVLNGLLAADAPALAAGLGAALSKRGWRFAIESGASIDPILHESVRDLAGTNRALDVYLRATGFAATERWNRVLAANTGAAYAKRLLPRAMMGHQRSIRVLTELGVDVATARQSGSLSADDVLMAAKRFSDITQFRSSPENLPDLASTEWGRVFFQFKNFAYNQTRFLHNQTVGELQEGEYGRGVRNLLILATLFPLTGEAVKDIRELIRGRARKARGLERYFENLGAVGSLGIAFDLVEGGRHGRSLEFFAGPTLSDVARLTNVIGAKNKPEAVKRLALQRFGSVGTAIAERVK